MPKWASLNVSSELRARALAGLLCGLFLAMVGAALWDRRDPLYLGQSLQNASYQMAFRLHQKLNPNYDPEINEVVLVYMDPESHSILNQPRDIAWDRAVHARALQKFTADGTKAVAYDIIFSGPHPTHPQGDVEFAKAIRENGKVVLGADLLPDPTGVTDVQIDRAYDPFYDAAASPLGLVPIWTGQDLIPYKHYHIDHKEPDSEISSLSWEVAALAGVPVAQSLENRLVDRMIRYYGPPLKALPSLSYYQIFAPSIFTTNDLIDLPLLANKLKRPSRAIDAWLATQLSSDTQQALTNYQGPGSDPKALKDKLTEDLLKIIDYGASIHEEQRFVGITLRSETKALMARNLQRYDLLRLNRFLIADAYPAEISTNQVFAQPPGFFKDKVVFVGSRIKTVYSGQRKDEYYSPYTQGSEFIPGVDVQATQFLNLLRDDWLRMPPPRLLRVILIIAGMVLGIGLIFMRPYLALLAGVVLAAGVTALAYYLFNARNVYSPWLIVVAVEIPVAALWSWGFNSFRLFVQNRLLDQSLSAYVSPAQVKQLLRRPEKLKPGAEKQALSILFSDIANFTSISEGMDSDDLGRVMNAYFERAVTRIHETEGTVVKFIGDAIFAIWNAPLPQPDHQLRAARAALLLSREVSNLIEAGEGPPLATRIGLHAGLANVGNFGGKTRFDYTAIGENINLASRMEGLNKYLGTTVLATAEIHDVVGEHLLWRRLGRFKLKGFEKAVKVFELLGEPAMAEGVKPWRDEFELALTEFQKAEFTAARQHFENVLTQKPGDGPARFYLDQIAALEKNSPPAGWTGDVEMKEK